jgi:diguanylate cyclase (GGDEF)-like protein
MSPASRDTATVHRHGAVAPAAHPSNAVLWPVASPDRWRTWHTDECPAELRRLLPSQPATIHALTVSERDEHLALIVIGVPTDAPFDDEVRREASELRDRVAVALAAARREKRLIERATRDSLTGLLNRAGLAEAVGMRIDTPDNGAEAFILFFVDLDKFKDVNDALGHQAGDELLCIVAQRLRDCATMDTLIARPGGDEFVLLVFGAVEDVATLAARICASLAEPIPLRGQVMSIGASVGLARYPDHGSTLDDLLRRADMAMYQAKAAGRGRFQWFEPALDRRAADRMSLLNDLRQAIPQHEFELHYQPRVSATTGQVRSVEALLRWRHPVRGLVLPAIFIDLLEETGMIEGVGHWVLETACTQLVRWRAQGLVLPCVAVNASPRQIDIPGYADRVLDTLDAAGLSPRDIELEVTESLFVDAGASSTGAALRRLREAGVGIAIDDFGTGYSSLSYLHRLPVDVLKIDRSFVEQLGAATDAEGVIHAIVALARTLKKRVVAEGVETAEQARHLRTVGCDEFQGYFYSRPLEPRALASWLAAQSTAAGQHLSADVV